jgi:hypothetical protein
MHLLYPLFGTYYEAITTLDFGPDAFVVTITDDCESLEHVNDNRHIVKIIGVGAMKSPGHPAGNQCFRQQKPFIKALITQGQVPVLHKFTNGVVEYLGMYRHLTTTIKLSDAGFRYYEYKLQRYNKTDKI